jgi:hypothetical protein
VAAARRRIGGLHSFRFSAQQRIHLATLLILAIAPFARAADIEFNPATTQEDFAKFSRVVAQSIFPTPIQPAAASGIFGFEVGVGGTAVAVDTKSSWWQNSVGNDFSARGYLPVPRLVITKGIGSGNISASYGKMTDTSIEMYGGSLDWALIDGGLVSPTLGLRGTYGVLKGVDTYDLKTYGGEVFLSKGFAFVIPYGAVGKVWSDAKGIVTPDLTFRDNTSGTRYTLGVRFSLPIMKLVFEASQQEERSYSAKISFGL